MAASLEAPGAMQSLVHVGLVAGGGALGALGRTAGAQLVASLVGTEPTPSKVMGTLAVNVLGCFLMGVGRAGVEYGGWGSDRSQAFLFSGFLGAFTTFSTFEADTMLLWRDGRRVAAGLYMGGSVALGVAAFLVGWALASRYIH